MHIQNNVNDLNNSNINKYICGIIYVYFLSDWKSRKQGVTPNSNTAEEERHFLSGAISFKRGGGWNGTNGMDFIYANGNTVITRMLNVGNIV